MLINGTMLTSDDNGKTIKVADGETIFVRLRENSTTGYQWDFEKLDEKMVKVERANYDRASDAVGSGGEATWAVKPQAQGTAKVNMKLWRQWEGDDSVVDRFGFTLKVAPKDRAKNGPKIVPKDKPKVAPKAGQSCSPVDGRKS